MRRRDKSLIVDFGRRSRVLSWAVVGGGARSARHVVWLQVTGDDLRPPVDPALFLQDHLGALGMSDAVGLLTSCDIGAFVDRSVTHAGMTARCVATVGLGNALRAGDPPGPPASVGTINVVCHVPAPLTPEAMVEAVALASEARALAVREAGIPSQRSGEPSSGTGTDCIVMAAPHGKGVEPYAGKHTDVGHVIGASVYEAIRDGVEGWLHRELPGRSDGGEPHA